MWCIAGQSKGLRTVNWGELSKTVCTRYSPHRSSEVWKSFSSSQKGVSGRTLLSPVLGNVSWVYGLLRGKMGWREYDLLAFVFSNVSGSYLGWHHVLTTLRPFVLSLQGQVCLHFVRNTPCLEKWMFLRGTDRRYDSHEKVGLVFFLVIGMSWIFPGWCYDFLLKNPPFNDGHLKTDSFL